MVHFSPFPPAAKRAENIKPRPVQYVHRPLCLKNRCTKERVHILLSQNAKGQYLYPQPLMHIRLMILNFYKKEKTSGRIDFCCLSCRMPLMYVWINNPGIECVTW